MALTLKQQEAAILKLPLKRRARLAEQLLASLDEPHDHERTQIWLKEADRRYRAYKQGHIPARSSKEVFKSALHQVK